MVEKEDEEESKDEVRSNYTDCHYRECRQIPRQFFVV
jgi:hypothetical protein